jgi:hypothetical protein
LVFSTIRWRPSRLDDCFFSGYKTELYEPIDFPLILRRDDKAGVETSQRILPSTRYSACDFRAELGDNLLCQPSNA